jgi:hypothetical protein
MHLCICTGTGALNLPQAQIAGISGTSTGANDEGLCDFACTRGYCPAPCSITNLTDPGPVSSGWTAFGDSYAAGSKYLAIFMR